MEAILPRKITSAKSPDSTGGIVAQEERGGSPTDSEASSENRNWRKEETARCDGWRSSEPLPKLGRNEPVTFSLLFVTTKIHVREIDSAELAEHVKAIGFDVNPAEVTPVGKTDGIRNILEKADYPESAVVRTKHLQEQMPDKDVLFTPKQILIRSENGRTTAYDKLNIIFEIFKEDILALSGLNTNGRRLIQKVMKITIAKKINKIYFFKSFTQRGKLSVLYYIFEMEKRGPLKKVMKLPMLFEFWLEPIELSLG
ncbi:unnamed protein product [Caenorhabditis sp. 36 PRJEB53466]|nr:unnamed protein product [Caenorhabditis sp. 36 PRJEB53466]